LKTADFTHPSLVWRSRSGRPLSNFVMKLGTRKLESRGYQMVKNYFFILTQYRRVTDRRTDTLLSQRPARRYASEGKNSTFNQ